MFDDLAGEKDEGSSHSDDTFTINETGASVSQSNERTKTPQPETNLATSLPGSNQKKKAQANTGISQPQTNEKTNTPECETNMATSLPGSNEHEKTPQSEANTDTNIPKSNEGIKSPANTAINQPQMTENNKTTQSIEASINGMKKIILTVYLSN